MTDPKLPSPPFPYDIMGYDAPRDALVGIDRDPEVVAKLQELLGEAGHVFKRHAEGAWSGTDGSKDSYAHALNEILDRYPGLVPRLLSLDNRVIKMVTYRALELRKQRATQ